MIANGIMLPGKKGVEHGYANPPIPVETGFFKSLLINWQGIVFAQSELAVFVAAQIINSLLITSVNLRPVPPMGHLINESNGGFVLIGHARGIGLGLAD